MSALAEAGDAGLGEPLAGFPRCPRGDRTVMGQSEASRPRDDNTFLVCEETGEMATTRGSLRPGECPMHGGDACLIVVGWVGKDWPQFKEAKS